MRESPLRENAVGEYVPAKVPYSIELGIDAQELRSEIEGILRILFSSFLYIMHICVLY